jgi:hypothetical protein
MVSVVTEDNRSEILKNDFEFFLSQGDDNKAGYCIKIEVLGRFKAASYNDMMQQYYDLMNYGKYVPIEDGENDAGISA